MLPSIRGGRTTSIGGATWHVHGCAGAFHPNDRPGALRPPRCVVESVATVDMGSYPVDQAMTSRCCWCVGPPSSSRAPNRSRPRRRVRSTLMLAARVTKTTALNHEISAAPQPHRGPLSTQRSCPDRSPWSSAGRAPDGRGRLAGCPQELVGIDRLPQEPGGPETPQRRDSGTGRPQNLQSKRRGHARPVRRGAGPGSATPTRSDPPHEQNSRGGMAFRRHRGLHRADSGTSMR